MSFRKEILDHGYLELVDTWGSEEQIIEAARMSTGKGFIGWGPIEKVCVHCHEGRVNVAMDAFHVSGVTDCPKCAGTGKVKGSGDEKLLRYLWENKHSTPFEMAGLTIEVQAPIFVFREWHRHRVPFSYNEMSARYVPLPDVNYVPTIERLMMNAGGSNKQAGVVKGAVELTTLAAEAFQKMLFELYATAEVAYRVALEKGVPKELARVHLPVGRYSRMRASANLRGWLAFISLRSAPNAQWEIRQYSDAVGELIGRLFPRTWSLFQESKK
jgi:thymidylate synthase (FAD)